ncbi:putative membrane protein [Halobacteriovorax sp. BALOs_7]|nr:hypothetical protein [Halobacteriovorax sp. BALOs_7]AYF43087.1 putative membrane protein [Halobacteriovorax sp. BALOs_7]
MQSNFYFLLLLYPVIYFLNNFLIKVTSINSKQRTSVLAFVFLSSFYFLFRDFIFSSVDRSYFAICSVSFSLFFLNSRGNSRVLFKAITLLWFSLFNIWNFTGVTDIVLLLGMFCFFDTDKKSEHSLFYNLSWIIIAVVYFFVKEFQGGELGSLFYEILLVVSTLLLVPKEKDSPFLSILQYIFCLSVLNRFIALNIELSPYFYLLFLFLQVAFSFIKIDEKYQAIQLMSICMASAIILLPVFGIDSFYQLFLIVYLLVFSYKSKQSEIVAKLLSIVHVLYLFLIGYVAYLHNTYLTNLQLLSVIFLIVTLAYRQNLFGIVQNSPRKAIV